MQHSLFASHLIGRSRACSLRLDNRLVSGEHATLRWNGGGWELRDLSSSNGTFVDQRRLAPGETVTISAGAQLAFGDARDAFALVDDSPPVAAALGSDGKILAADDGMLVLPHPDTPELIVFEDGPGRWFIEDSSGDCRAVDDHEVIHVGAASWRLMLPAVWEPTWQPDGNSLKLADITFRFRASRNQEHVDIEMIAHGRVIALEPRSHGYLLFLLAQERWEDAQDTTVLEPDHGWMYVDDLMNELATSEGMINVAIHRARAQLRQAHVLDADRLIERRRTSREIRLGIRRIELVDHLQGRSRPRRRAGRKGHE